MYDFFFLLQKITQTILAFPFRDMKWKDSIWKCISWNLPQNTAWGLSEQFLECVLFIWNILICLTFYTIFSPANFFLTKKVAHFAIIIPLWTITGWVVLPCFAHLVLSLEMAHAIQNWVTLLQTGAVCPWLCAEFGFSSNWKLSCEQSWQDADCGRQF